MLTGPEKMAETFMRKSRLFGRAWVYTSRQTSLPGWAAWERDPGGRQVGESASELGAKAMGVDDITRSEEQCEHGAEDRSWDRTNF